MEDRFSDDGEGELDVVGVRGLRDIRHQVQVGPVELLEAPKDVLHRLVDVGTADVVGEVLFHRRVRKLLDEDVDLVQAENYCGSAEPHGVHDGLKEVQRLLEAVLRRRLKQRLVVLTQSNAENDCSDIVKTMNPFLSL